MNLNKHEERLKHALEIERRLNELYKQRWSRPSRKLDKPIQRGFVRSYVIRDDVKSRPDILKIKEVLERVNSETYCEDVKFEHRQGKRRFPMYQPLRTVTDPRFYTYWSDYKQQAEWNWIGEHRKYLTYCCLVQLCPEHYNYYKQKKTNPHYHVRFPWMYELKTKPYMLTHYYLPMPEVEAEISRLQGTMYDNGYWQLLSNHHGRSHKNYKRDEEVKESLLAKRAKQEINQALFDLED